MGSSSNQNRLTYVSILTGGLLNFNHRENSYSQRDHTSSSNHISYGTICRPIYRTRSIEGHNSCNSSNSYSQPTSWTGNTSSLPLLTTAHKVYHFLLDKLVPLINLSESTKKTADKDTSVEISRFSSSGGSSLMCFFEVISFSELRVSNQETKYTKYTCFSTSFLLELSHQFRIYTNWISEDPLPPAERKSLLTLHVSRSHPQPPNKIATQGNPQEKVKQSKLQWPPKKVATLQAMANSN